MKIRRAEFLVAIAIVTSAAVLQIREHMQSHDVASANSEATRTVCGGTGNGLVPASCEPTRDERPTNSAPQQQHGAPQIWV